jgi:hypothetical protein
MSFYPAPPGRRMAYDRDGSIGVFNFTLGNLAGFPQIYSAAEMQASNSEANNIVGNYGGAGFHNTETYFTIIFPELRDLVGYFLAMFSDTAGHTSSSPADLSTSANTTNGIDGTWITRAANPTFVLSANGISPTYRSSITTLSVPGIKAIRFNSLSTFFNPLYSNFHLYGAPSAGQDPDSLRFWLPTTDAELSAPLDLGDMRQGDIQVQSFRIHNNSSTKTASGITVSAEISTDASPSLTSQYQFSTDNVTFSPFISIPSLAPGATSSVLYVRYSVASNAQLSVWDLRMVAVPGSFV